MPTSAMTKRSMTTTPRARMATAMAIVTATVTAALSACSMDPPPADPAGAPMPSMQQRLQKLAACTPTDLVVLLPWTGPAFDPASGALLAPLPAGHLEAVAQGWRNYGKAATELRHQEGARVAQDVFTHPGLLGFQSVESQECDISISHTLWRDEASMWAFVTGPSHVSAMTRAHEMHHAVAGAHWSGDRRTTPPTWKEGLSRMVKEEGGASP
jgi:hypothetical protein